MSYKVEFKDKTAANSVYGMTRHTLATRGNTDYTTGIRKEGQKTLLVVDTFLPEIQRSIARSGSPRHTLTEVVDKKD